MNGNSCSLRLCLEFVTIFCPSMFQKPTDELGKEYVLFVSANLDMMRNKTTDEIFVNNLFTVID